MRNRIYMETTVPSFLYEKRIEPDMAARQRWTREWWDHCRESYELFTSEATIEELERGDFPQRQDAPALAKMIPLLEMDEPVGEIAEAYIRHRVMPAEPIAMLSTWRCHPSINATFC